MTRPDDEYPPLDVTSTLHMGGLDEVLEGAEVTDLARLHAPLQCANDARRSDPRGLIDE